MGSLPVWEIIQAVTITYCSSHTQIGVREHVRAAQRKDQEHLRCPAANSLDLRERVNNTLVRQSPDVLEIDGSIIHLALQVSQIGHLLG